MKNYFVSMYQILKAFEVASYQDYFDYSLFESDKLGITDKEIQIILKNALDEGLIKGIYMSPILKGFKAVSPQLTTKGYDFLENNSSMKKAYNLLKEMKGWIPGL